MIKPKTKAIFHPPSQRLNQLILETNQRLFALRSLQREWIKTREIYDQTLRQY